MRTRCIADLRSSTHATEFKKSPHTESLRASLAQPTTWLWQGFLRRACAFSENGFSPLRVCFLSKFLRNLSDFSSKTIRRLVTAVSLMTATRLTQVYQTLKPAPLSILQDCCLPQDALRRTSPLAHKPHPSDHGTLRSPGNPRRPFQRPHTTPWHPSRRSPTQNPAPLASPARHAPRSVPASLY